MEITFVGINADTSPPCVSIIGRAVREPFPCSSPNFADLSSLNADKTSPGASRPGGLRNSDFGGKQRLV